MTALAWRNRSDSDRPTPDSSFARISGLWRITAASPAALSSNTRAGDAAITLAVRG